MKVLIINKTPLGSAPTECTSAMVTSAIGLGHHVYGCRMADVAMTNDGVVARSHRVSAAPSVREQACEPARPLAWFDAVVNRHDPPVDMAYVTMMLALRHAESVDGAYVCNPASAVLRGSEKTLALAFPHLTPPTVVSSDIETLTRFRNEHGAVVLKPLYDCGGHGIRVVLDGDDFAGAVRAMLGIEKAPVLVQRFLPEVVEGDTRVLLVGDTVVGAFKRIPQPGSYLANLCAGGRLAPTVLDAREQEVAETVGRSLREWGVTLCGIDLIGGCLTELNVTSTVGFRQIRQLYGRDVGPDFWNAVEAGAPATRPTVSALPPATCGAIRPAL